MDYVIRLADSSDCKRLSMLKKEIWETTYRGIYPDSKIDDYDYLEHENKFRNFVSDVDIKLYVVVDDDIVGYMACGKPYRSFKDYERDITLLYLKKEYQGYGIGKRLFLLANDTFKKDGYNRFFINCNKYNEKAQRFYEKMGGKVVAVDEDCLDKSESQIHYHYDVV